jgi:hypothetical protein
MIAEESDEGKGTDDDVGDRPHMCTVKRNSENAVSLFRLEFAQTPGSIERFPIIFSLSRDPGTSILTSTICRTPYRINLSLYTLVFIVCD